MGRQRLDKLEPDKQERLFTAAAEEFAAHGYEAASVNRILGAAQMSKGVLYYYFDDKADLFATVVERAVARMLAAAGGLDLDALTAETYWAQLEHLVRRSSQFLSRHDWAARLVRAFTRTRIGSGGASGQRIAQAVEHWTIKLLTRGQQLGVVRDDLPIPFLASMCLALGEAGDRWLLEHWEILTPADRERLVAGEMDLFRRMLSITPPQAPADQKEIADER